jgi:membrane protease YdiL (CAAX protease family)
VSDSHDEEFGEVRLGADLLPEPTPTPLPPKLKIYRGNVGDPFFGFLIAIAISIGLTPILPAQADLRYTLALGAMAGIAVLTWLLGNFDHITQETPENLIWGIGFGLLFSVPFLLFFYDTFRRASLLVFPDMPNGALLAYLLFVMPLAETLFFRGLMQRSLEFWATGLVAGLWSAVLFFPVMWGDIVRAPAVAFFLLIALAAMNMLYSYVRERNGLAAAWLCQIVVGLIVFFLPHV